MKQLTDGGNLVMGWDLAEGAVSSSPRTSCSVSVWRICEHCNKEYLVPLCLTHNDGRQESVHNFGECPNCGKRDDVWIRVEVKPNKVLDDKSANAANEPRSDSK